MTSAQICLQNFLNARDRCRYESNMDGYRERAKKCVKDSLSQVYNPPLTEDPHYITFSPYNNEIHDPVRQKIYEPKVIFYYIYIVLFLYLYKNTIF